MDYTDNLHAVIAENIREERKKQHISQEWLAELADISVDTVRNAESGRKKMRMDTYLRIVQALKTTPAMLINGRQPEELMEQLCFLMAGHSKSEIEFIVHMVEHLLEGLNHPF